MQGHEETQAQHPKDGYITCFHIPECHWNNICIEKLWVLYCHCGVEICMHI